MPKTLKRHKNSSFFIVTGEKGAEEYKRVLESEQETYVKGYYKHNIKCQA